MEQGLGNADSGRFFLLQVKLASAMVLQLIEGVLRSRRMTVELARTENFVGSVGTTTAHSYR